MERLIYHEVEFDDRGFRRPGMKSWEVSWGEVRRAAFGFEVDELAISDRDFWAFQTADPGRLLEVEIGSISTLRFSDEIHRRYGKPEINGWPDTSNPIHTFIIYPPEEVGKPLYALRKKHWYSLKGYIEFARP